MSSYYLHDGRNEAGPFSIEILKKQKLSRNTPIRLGDTNNWMPAEKLPELKPLVAPRKIRRPKDVMPVLIERVGDFKQRQPKTLYACVLGAALLASYSIYSITKSTTVPADRQPLAAEQTGAANAGSQKMAPAGVAATNTVTATTAEEDKAKQARLRWNKLITATNSNYGIGFLGGIKDLKVIVTNRSDYPIDEAVVDVTYIKASGGVWKAKPIIISGIAAHESKEQSVPDVGRGKKVSVSLKKLVSKKMKFSYAAGKKISNSDDPYFKE